MDVTSLEKGDYAGTARPDVLAIIPRSALAILDVGCASGELGEDLRRRQSAEVIGIELSPTLAELAAARLSRVLVGTVEERLSDLADNAFDCVICADVLEHMVNPYQVLRALRPKLRPGGVLVASIPNVRHYRIVANLALRGRWEYGPTGLLDSGHLRFFTRSGIEHMFRWAGYSLQFHGPKLLARTDLQRLNRLLRGRLNPFLEYQFLLVARPDASAPESNESWWARGRPL